MVTLFVSHSHEDRVLATRVADGLRAAGFVAVFVDVDRDQGIPVGRNWERELYAQLRQAAAVVFLASAASVVSRWCFAELSVARSLGRPVFPLRLQPDAWLPLLDDVHWADLTDDPDRDLTRLVADLRTAGVDPEDAFVWDARRSPYPGLQPFAREDAAVFFGRRPETGQLTTLLQPTLLHQRGRFVAVVGPSGSGKSSLLHAGLLPRLERRGHWLVLPPLLPGTQPIGNLAGCLQIAFARLGRPRSRDELAQQLGGGSTALVDIVGDLTELAPNGSSPLKVLLVVDQAEELLTRSGWREQRAFLDLVTGALHDSSPVWAVATVRSEFLSTAPDRAGLAEAVDDSVVIEPLSRARLADVIAGLAERAGLEFPQDLVARMVQDAEGGDALPLLAFTLRELFRRAGPERRIRDADYALIGGVVGALKRRADQLADELGRVGMGEQVVPTLIKFAAVSGDEEPTRRRVARDTLSTAEKRVVDAFIEARLLTSDRPASDDPIDVATIEVAHEALLRQWPRLRDGIEADRAGLRLRSELERQAADWEQAGQDESYLLRGARLAAINDWVEKHSDELTRLERRYLEASRAQTVQELERARRSNGRLRSLVAALGLLLAVALVAGLLAWQQNGQAQQQARLAWSRQLSAQSERLANGMPDAAMLTGLQSMSLARDQDPIPPAGLVTALARITRPSWRLDGHTGPANSAAFNPSGTLLATASDDQTVRLWDTRSRRPHGPALVGHSEVVRAAVFSPDGRLLATAADDRTIRLWDVATGQPHGLPLLGHTDWVWGVAFSPDGGLLASAGADRTVRLWDVATGRPHGSILTGHTDRVSGLAFSPDGAWLATAGIDRTVRLWDMSGREVLSNHSLSGHAGPVVAVAFSPDGGTLASTSTDRTVRLWDVPTAQPRGEPLTGHTGQTNAVAFSPDGGVVAAASGDASVRLWDTGTGLPHGLPLIGHADWVSGLAFSPDGTQLATASADQTVRLWRLAEDAELLSRTLLGHGGPVAGVAVSPDGRWVASAGADRAVRLWDAATGRPHGPALQGHTGPVLDVAFSPDGQALASAAGDGTVRLWDVASGQPRGAPLVGHVGWGVRAVAFSPDGLLLASAGEDRTVRLWDASTGQLRGDPLFGHTGQTTDVAFSSDGKVLASASLDRTIRLWDPAVGAPRGLPLRGHTNAVNVVAFSPDGRLLASGSEDRTVRLWDVETHAPHGEPLIGHTGSIYGVAFGQDASVLATASADQGVRQWDVRTGRVRGPVLTGHYGWVTAVAFNRDGTTLATSSTDGAVRLWNPHFHSWAAVGCRLVNRNLTTAEWNQAAPGLPYQRTCPDQPAGAGAPPDAPAAEY